MLSVIEVKCPHCGAVGQIIVPPLGQITIGPCPRCQELVVLFEGRVFPLDKETMIYGTTHQKRKHLCSTLTQHLKDQVSELIPDDHELDASLSTDGKKKQRRRKAKPSVRDLKDHGISKHEIEDFLRIDVPLLSKKEYFERHFGKIFDKKDKEES
jgi:phage FluMu protein Com